MEIKEAQQLLDTVRQLIEASGLRIRITIPNEFGVGSPDMLLESIDRLTVDLPPPACPNKDVVDGRKERVVLDCLKPKSPFTELTSKHVETIGDFQIKEVLLEDPDTHEIVKWYKIYQLTPGFLKGKHAEFCAHQPTLELAREAINQFQPIWDKATIEAARKKVLSRLD